MVSIQKAKSKKYKVSYGTVLLNDVAVKAKPMPSKFINKRGNFVTKAFVDYLKPLVGELPDYASLKAIRVRKK
jgi:6-phosphofructokinase 1